MREHVVLSVALGFALGCNCGTRTHSAAGQLQLSPSTVNFGPACVKPSDPTLQVLPVTQSLVLQNVGVAAMTLATIVVDGGTAFTFPSDWPRDLSGGQAYSLPISFLPSGPGTVSAVLTVTDVQSQSQSATLTGSGSAMSADPVPVLHCAAGRLSSDGGPADQCYDWINQQTSPNPLMWFADAVAGDGVEANLVIENTGCAVLGVMALNVDGGSLQSDAFVLVDASGNPVPSGLYPAFSVASGVQSDAGSTAVRVRFQPKASGVFQGALLLTTNVPGANTLGVSLLGSGVTPSLQLCADGGTPACSTTSFPLTCDFSAVPACTGAFVAHNSGGANISLKTIRLTQGDSQFAVSAAPTLPALLTPTGTGQDSVAITVSYTPRSQYDYDILEVSSNGGVQRALVQGGQPPSLVIVPAAGDLPDTVDFNRDAAGNGIPLPNGFTGTKTFQIQNAGQGPLTIEKVYFRETGTTAWPAGVVPPTFALTPPPANTVIPPAGSANVGVQFTDAPNGGPSGSSPLLTDLRIDSNDPRWPPPNGSKAVTVQAKTPCNPSPVAVVNGPSGSASKDTTVTLDASASYDIKPDGSGSCQPGLQCTFSPPVSGCPAGPITHWEWQLLTVPANAGPNVSLTPSGLGTSSTAQLKLGDCAPCSYVVRLFVYDDTPPTAGSPNGLKSNSTDFTVNVP